MLDKRLIAMIKIKITESDIQALVRESVQKMLMENQEDELKLGKKTKGALYGAGALLSTMVPGLLDMDQTVDGDADYKQPNYQEGLAAKHNQRPDVPADTLDWDDATNGMYESINRIVGTVIREYMENGNDQSVYGTDPIQRNPGTIEDKVAEVFNKVGKKLGTSQLSPKFFSMAKSMTNGELEVLAASNTSCIVSVNGKQVYVSMDYNNRTWNAEPHNKA